MATHAAVIAGQRSALLQPRPAGHHTHRGEQGRVEAAERSHLRQGVPRLSGQQVLGVGVEEGGACEGRGGRGVGVEGQGVCPVTLVSLTGEGGGAAERRREVEKRRWRAKHLPRRVGGQEEVGRLTGGLVGSTSSAAATATARIASRLLLLLLDILLRVYLRGQGWAWTSTAVSERNRDKKK